MDSENIPDAREQEALCMKQAGLLQQDEAEISALKKQVMELAFIIILAQGSTAGTVFLPVR